MGEYILGIAGIAVSVGLFFLGYRQTIGARKERTRSANEEIEKILVRRIVLEEYAPRVEDIARLIDGKARDFHVRPMDLLSEGQLLNNIFTRVVETDFIPRELPSWGHLRPHPRASQRKEGVSTVPPCFYPTPPAGLS